MRPLLLEVEGFTSFRERTELDFDGLDLFAITGPTGAGKSSLIDAIVFALYGQVPRVGRSYKQLISHGAERLSVRLDFEVGGQVYRVVRAVRGRGQGAVRLERIAAGEVKPIADRVREVEAEVERIVGLDYEAFTRSVVLPQGQFDAFLKGEPEERRKILVALLNLGVYEEMHAIVNRRAGEARTRAGVIASQLDKDFAEATAEKLAARRSEAEQARRERKALDKRVASLRAGVEAAREVRGARAEAQRLKAALEQERERRRQAQATLEQADQQRARLVAALEQARGRLARVEYAPARQLRLAATRPEVERLARSRQRCAKLEAEAAELRRAVETTAAGVGAARRVAAEAEAEEERRRAASDAARAEQRRLQARHAAHALRLTLAPGDPCPVCEQTVARVPVGEAPGLEAAGTALAAAEGAAEQARDRRERSGRALALAEKEGEARERERDRHAEALQEASRERLAVDQRLSGDFEEAERADPAALALRVDRELKRLESSRAERERLERECGEREREQARLEATLGAASQAVEDAGVRIAEVEAGHDAAWRSFEAARETLLARSRRAGWQGLDRGGDASDEVDVLDELLQVAQHDASDTSQRQARLEATVEHLEKAVARGEELRGELQQLQGEAALCGSLAQHLQANQFVGYVQEEALRVLAEDGSRHLEGLSQGRYSLESESQDFQVVDHWNADQRRSVKTLSGGESFLASLALALALAERLAELSAEGRAGEALESLFLDEGFGTLDPEALDLVVQAIEALQGGQRVVGVVTHIQPLAERLPARVEVSRSQSGARLALA